MAVNILSNKRLSENTRKRLAEEARNQQLMFNDRTCKYWFFDFYDEKSDKWVGCLEAKPSEDYLYIKVESIPSTGQRFEYTV